MITIQMNNFAVIRNLGEGSFGTVLLVRRISDGQLYAMKQVDILTLNDKER